MFSEIINKIKKISKEHTVRCDRDIYDVYKNMIHFRCKFAVVLTVCFAIASTTAFASPNVFDVKIIDGSQQYAVSTVGTTVADVLAQLGIDTAKYDLISPERDSNINSPQTIVIHRIKRVTVTSGGKVKKYMTSADTVGDFLEEKGFDINFHDIVSLPLETKLGIDTELTVTRVIKRIEKVDNLIPYNTKTIRDSSMSISESIVKTKGVEGVDRETYEVLLYDGVEQSRELLFTERISDPVDEIKVVGNKGGKFADKGKDFSYSNVLTCNATAYDLSYQSCGKLPGQTGYGITASGTQAKYGTVAVDPNLIPLGTRMFIESVDGSFVYGYCVAEDTGGAIKGKKVDLFFDTYEECMQFGKKPVKVYILD